MLDFIDQQFNEELLQQFIIIQSPNGIQLKQQVTQKQIKDLEEIYQLFDEDGKGYIEGDRILLLFQILLFVNQEAIAFKGSSFKLYYKQFGVFCKNLQVYEGKLTTRLFKQYFIMNQLATDEIYKQIKQYFHSLIGLQKYKLIDKSFFLSLSLSAKQKSIWIQNINQKIDSNTFIREIQKNKQFNQQQLEKLILCDQYVRLLYLFLIENFESLKYYFDMEQKTDIYYLSEELTRIFNSIYSQHSSIIIMDNIDTLFYIFGDAYSILFKENAEIFFNIYSSFMQEKKLPGSSIKQILCTYSYDESNCLIKKYCVDLQIPVKIVNKNKSENYIFDKQNIAEKKINSNKSGQVKQSTQNDSKLISPVNKKAYNQYKNQQQPLVKNIKILHNISYLTPPQKINNNNSFSPSKIKQNQKNKKDLSLSPELNQNKFYSTQSQMFTQNPFESSPTGSGSMTLYKTQSLSPQNPQGNFNYLEYLKSQLEFKRQIERNNNTKSSKIQSMIKSNWIEFPQHITEQKNQINESNQFN